MLPYPRTGLLIVVSGLLAEARIARGQGVHAIAGGGNAARLANDIDRVIAYGAGGLLSFGIAGGLEPGLAPGRVIIPSVVVNGEEQFTTDEGWTERLWAAQPDSVARAVAGTNAPVASLSAKKALRAATNAAAADMESHIVARAAARAGLPFAVLRVIADPAERELPDAVIAGMRNDGGPDVRALVHSLAQNPAQFGALLRVVADAGRAIVALGRCKRALGPQLGFRLHDRS